MNYEQIAGRNFVFGEDCTAQQVFEAACAVGDEECVSRVWSQLSGEQRRQVSHSAVVEAAARNAQHGGEVLRFLYTFAFCRDVSDANCAALHVVHSKRACKVLLDRHFFGLSCAVRVPLFLNTSPCEALLESRTRDPEAAADILALFFQQNPLALDLSDAGVRAASLQAALKNQGGAVLEELLDHCPSLRDDILAMLPHDMNELLRCNMHARSVLEVLCRRKLVNMRKFMGDCLRSLFHEAVAALLYVGCEIVPEEFWPRYRTMQWQVCQIMRWSKRSAPFFEDATRARLLSLWFCIKCLKIPFPPDLKQHLANIVLDTERKSQASLFQLQSSTWEEPASALNWDSDLSAFDTGFIK